MRLNPLPRMTELARTVFQRRRRIARLVSNWMWGRAVFPKWSARELAEEGYRQNVVVYRCIREIAESAAEPQIEARHRGATEPLTMRHPLVQLLHRPNPEQSCFGLIESLVTHQQTSGNWYTHTLRNAFGLPVEVWPLHPDRTKIVPGPSGEVERYDYYVDGSGIPVPIPAEDVIHDKLLDPLDDYYGLSPIAVAAAVVDLDSEAIKYLRSFFLNNATPAGIVKVTQRLKREQRREIRDEWEAQFQGEKGWHSVAVLDQDADYKPVGFPLKDLDLQGVLSQSEARLCAAFGVPPILIGVKMGLQTVSYAEHMAARRSFWVETLKPMYRRLADRLTFSLAPEFGSDIEIGFNFDSVGALQEDLESVRKFAFLGWDKGVLTRNEARERVGLPKVDNGDVYRSTGQDVFTEEGELPPATPVNRLPADAMENGTEP